MRNILFALCLLASPGLAMAAEKPPELSAMKAESPVGSATLRKLMLHVYDASFWSDSGGWSKTPYALSITYAMNFSPDELADRTLDEMKQVSDLPEATLAGYAQQLRTLYPNVKDGDRITALQKDAATTVFYHNGKKRGEVRDAAFAKPFFGIWLSPKSSEPDMQQKLLPTNR